MRGRCVMNIAASADVMARRFMKIFLLLVKNFDVHAAIQRASDR